jgi:hypothetical protein
MDPNDTSNTKLVSVTDGDKALFNELLDFLMESSARHPEVSQTSTLMVMGQIIGSVIAAGYSGGQAIIKESVVKNIDLAMDGFKLLGTPAAGHG